MVNRVNRFLVQPVAEGSYEMAGLFKIPPNYVIVFPTVHGQFSKRNTETGSWLLQELKNVVLEANETYCNFFHLVTKVTQKVAYNHEAEVFKRDENGEVKYQNEKPVRDKQRSGGKNAVNLIHSLTDPLILNIAIAHDEL